MSYKYGGLISIYSMKRVALILACVAALAIISLSQGHASEGIKDKPMQVLKKNIKRAMLTKLRGGDFAHAGDREAIDFVINKLNKHTKSKKGNILDVGCGYGGTAEYFVKNGYRNVLGIDIDKNAVDYANLKYSNIKFFHYDVLNIQNKFDKNYFSLIYMFNVVYAIKNKKLLVDNLSAISKKGAILAIFDYSVKLDPNNIGSEEYVLKDFSGVGMHPVDPKALGEILETKGWRILEANDITDLYIKWYEEFMSSFSSQRNFLIKTYNEKDVEGIETLFNKLLQNLKKDELGGVLIIAEKVR